MTESVLMPFDYKTRRYKPPETSRRGNNLILLRSGDVERNPGPTIKSCLMILALVLLLAGDVESNPGPGVYGACGECNKDFTKKMTPIECSGCHRKFHKTTCTGSTRWAIEKILAQNRDWNCTDCTAGRPPQQVQQPQAAPTPPGKCQGKDCGNQIRKGVDFIICTKCKAHFHKQQRCSEMTRQQVENLDRTIWQCLGCQQTETNPRSTASDQDEEPSER